MVSPTRLVQAITPVNVLTYHNDNLRSGHNLNETLLTPANVNARTFGKLFAYLVDGAIYAEPLYVSQLSIPGKGIRSVVYVATQHDSVYAFFAGGAGLLWHRSFINPPTVTTVLSSDLSCSDISPEIGITGTPVIDRTTQTLYVVSKINNQGAFFQQLHALDLATGAEKFGGPVNIAASAPGSGYDNVGGVVSFNPLMENQRPALLLSNGIVYIAWAGHCDHDPYHGWVLAYDALTLTLNAVFNDTPNGSEGGIWSSGNGPSAGPGGAIFVGSGNGTFDANAGGADYGDSFIRLAPKTLTPLDYFTPSDQATLEANDSDFGSTGAVLLNNQPGSVPQELFGGGKDGTLFVLKRGNMGHYCPPPCSNSQVVQQVPGLSFPLSAPAYWHGFVYIIPDGQGLLEFGLANGRLSSTPIGQTSLSFGSGKASPAVSANGSTKGIVWAIANSEGLGPPAVLYAFRATNVSQELYDSTQAPNGRDTAGAAVKFTVPTVANGKVYVGTATELDVYGLLPP
jgi:hypothetical protein